ncbi:MAG TPA: pyridoxamine 5'-phosphate oxidase family protein [Devosia sp.]|nr:pyridoxamine 5'-phosphate oxidase family protein [Devosia sp.]
MAKQFPQLETHHHEFIARQHMFFTATAAATGHVNVSPRGTDQLRVLDNSSVLYLDRTGSGNETAAHLKLIPRMTIMFCAVDGPPLILRLYGNGRVLPRNGHEYERVLNEEFDGIEPLGARQMVRLDFDLVQTSCGYGVPLYDYQGERDTIDRWSEAKGPDGLAAYWREKNQTSIDGFPTGLFDE